MKKLNKEYWYRLLVEVICWAFFVLFVYAAFSKWFEFAKFKVTIGQSAMLTPYAGILAWMVPAVEIGIALLLGLNLYRLRALYASLSLMTMFTTYIVIIILFMPDIPCSCGGVLQQLGWQEHLIFNLIFMILGVIGIMLRYSIGQFESGITPNTLGKKSRH